MKAVGYKNWLICLFIAQALFTESFALTSLSSNKKALIPNSIPYVVTLSLGPSWTNSGDSQTFYLESDVEKTYTENTNTSTMVNAELFVGAQSLLSKKITGQLGLAFGYAGNAKLTGDIWDDANPTFNNYSYTYYINHRHIVLKGKLITATNLKLQLYISGSIGGGYNRSYDFTVKPTNSYSVAMPTFTNSTQAALVYSLGIGAEMPVSKDWKVGVGYEFLDWGQSMLGRAPGQVTSSTVSQQNLYAQNLVFNLTYVN